MRCLTKYLTNNTMKNGNFITIQGWMINELGLRGNELMCYALIYGFSQDGESSFKGGRKYIANLLGASLPTVDKVLDNLKEKGFISRISQIVNGVTFISYKCIPLEDFTTHKEFLCGGSKNFLHDNNNIDIYNKEEIDKSISKKEKKDELFEQCWKDYRRKGSKAKAKIQWDKLKQDEKEAIPQHIKAYTSTRELQYQKDFERYLKDKIFNTIVFNNNQIAYDPTIGETNEYNPTLTSQLLYHNDSRCYLYIGYFNGFIGDGYDDNNRPDGASIILNNGRGKITWNKKQKQWIQEK